MFGHLHVRVFLIIRLTNKKSPEWVATFLPLPPPRRGRTAGCTAGGGGLGALTRALADKNGSEVSLCTKQSSGFWETNWCSNERVAPVWKSREATLQIYWSVLALTLVCGHEITSEAAAPHRGDPELSAGIINPVWDSSGSTRGRWRGSLRRTWSGFLSWTCWLLNPTMNKQKKPTFFKIFFFFKNK